VTATTQKEKDALREGGRRLALVLEALARAVRPGLTTQELDTLAEELIRKGGDEPAFLHYQPRGASYPYPATLCISINDEIVHGIPGERTLQEGDIVGLDLGLSHEGFFVDAARTIPVGTISDDARALLSVTEEALQKGIGAALLGNRISDISVAIESVAKKNKVGIVRELGGHGVGKKVHEPPFIPNFVAGRGPLIEEGMVLAIEPMFNSGGDDVILEKDGYTYRTADGSLSAHFENTILVTKEGPVVLTRA